MKIGLSQPRVRAVIGRLVRAGLLAGDPVLAMRRHVRRADHRLQVGSRWYDLRRYRRVVAVGAGKASARMGQALEAILGDRLEAGLIVVKYGHGASTKRIRVVEAGHPVPDQAGLYASERMLTFVRGLAAEDLLFVLLSGGASSLLPAPVAGLTLAAKQDTTRLLLRSGATIQEINAVRKHLSAIKGGQLAAAMPAHVVSLVLSDVIGDDLGSIGSGPTAPDSTTYAEARDILTHYGIWKNVPATVRNHLSKGSQGDIAETPKPGSALFRHVQHHIIGNNQGAVDAVEQAARMVGMKPVVLSTTLTGEAKEVAKIFGAMGREIVTRGKPIRRPCCLIAGGELTVTVRGNGRGGRAQEFALAAACEIAGLRNVWIAAAGTDGTDGPTDAAGAVVDGQTMARATRLGMSSAKMLQENNSYEFFHRLRNHIVTGPTGTNVNDLYLLIAL